jgi:hypothetical protein
MTISYTFQYRLFPKQWSAPVPPDETEDVPTMLIYRRLVAVYLRETLDLLNTWRYIFKYTYPIFILTFAMGFIGWSTFLILSFIVAILSIVIWVKIKIYHRTVAFFQIVIDEIIYSETGIRLPNILEKD